jgi:mRNA degradation ribonuclease J1/J2
MRNDDMRILPLGVGGAFTERFYHNNYIFEWNGKRLLIDAGTTLRYSLPAAGFKATDIDFIFITHFHSDHVGGLEEFLQRCYFRLENGKHTPHQPTLFMTLEQRETFYESLSLGLNTNGLTLNDYCQVKIIEDSFQIGDVSLKPINTNELHCKGMQSYAIQVTNLTDNSNLLFSSDIKDLSRSGFLDYINPKTKAIFQDVQFFYVGATGAHAEFDEVLAYYPSSMYEMIYLMHYTDGVEDHMDLAMNHGFKFVVQGELIAL